MPRYFFHLADGLGRTSDHEGSNFQSEQQARREAVRTGKQLVTGRLGKGSARSLALAGRIEVVNDQDTSSAPCLCQMRLTPPEESG